MNIPFESFPSYWGETSHCIEKHHAQLYRLLLALPYVSDRMTMYKARTGALTVKYHDIMLHSMYDPQQEAMRFIAAQDIMSGDTVIIYGFGLGYHLEACLRVVGKDGRVYVVEPNLEVIKAACTLRDLKALMEDDRLSVITGESEESVALRFLALLDRQRTAPESVSPKIVVHEASFKIIPPGFDRLRNSFDMLLMERRAPEVFEEKNVENVRINLETVMKSPGIVSLRGHFKGVPALFINAGPSLDHALASIHSVKHHAVILCSDTALPALMDRGITPDFVVSVDPQAKSSAHFKGYYEASSVLLFLPSSAHEVVQNYQGAKVVVLQKGHSITKRMEKALEYKGFTMEGSSVSCIGLDMLIQMGCDPIVFVGMDYAFPGGKMYSSGVAETKKWTQACYSLTTLESMHFESIHGAETMTIPNKLGEDILTYQTLYAYLRHIERLIAETPNVRFYNYLSKGVPIQGSEDVYLAEELGRLVPTPIMKALPVTEEHYDRFVFEQLMESLPSVSHESATSDML